MKKHTKRALSFLTVFGLLIISSFTIFQSTLYGDDQDKIKAPLHSPPGKQNQEDSFKEIQREMNDLFKETLDQFQHHDPFDEMKRIRQQMDEIFKSRQTRRPPFGKPLSPHTRFFSSPTINVEDAGKEYLEKVN